MKNIFILNRKGSRESNAIKVCALRHQAKDQGNEPNDENQETESPSEGTDPAPGSAEDLQQFYYECFGDRDWNAYNQNEHIFLKRNIGYAIFGSPNELTDNNIQDTTIGYKKKQNKQIEDVYKAIIYNHYLENSSVFLVRTIFVCCELKNKKKSIIVEPVFVLKKCHGEKDNSTEQNCKVFIDSNARVYTSWEHYLENNKLPKCRMVYPKNGQYLGEIIEDNEEKVRVILESKDSPACKIGKQVLEGADTAGTAISVGTTLTLVAAAIPGIAVAPALITGAAIGGLGVGIYSVGRSVQTLVDRKKHEQSIGLDNSESRWCWLNTGVGILGASASAASGLLTRAASRGVEISKAAQIAFNTINTANIVGNATNLAFCGYNVIDKLINKEPITALEIFQITSSALFFHNSISNFKTANTIISETQSQTLLNYEQQLRSNRHRRLFRKAQLESRRLKGEMTGNAEVISGVRNINDPDNFFAGLARINKDLNQNGGRYTITPEGKIEINSNYIVDPMEFATISKDSRVNILKTLPSYQQTAPKITPATFEAKQFFITTCCEKLLLNSTVVTKIIQEIINNKFDLDTMTVLFQNYQEDIIYMFMSILAKFLCEISENVQEFKKLHPMVSFSVGACQYLIYFVQNLCKEQDIEISYILVSAFNHDNTVNDTFLAELSQSFRNWLQNQIEKLSFAVDKVYEDLNRIKERKVCEICTGHYFQSVKK